MTPKERNIAQDMNYRIPHKKLPDASLSVFTTCSFSQAQLQANSSMQSDRATRSTRQSESASFDRDAERNMQGGGAPDRPFDSQAPCFSLSSQAVP